MIFFSKILGLNRILKSKNKILTLVYKNECKDKL